MIKVGRKIILFMSQKDNQVKIKKLPDLENKITVIYGSDILND